MSAIYYQKGDIIDYKNEGEDAIEYRDVVTIGSLIGIATEKIEAGATGSVAVDGVWQLPCPESIEAGKAVYWDGDAAAASGETFAGVAMAAADGAYVPVKINMAVPQGNA